MPTPHKKPQGRFLRARREWDDRYSSLAHGKRNWQLAALGLLAANLALSAALAWLSTQSRITPYIVEVDTLGQARAFGPAERLRKTDERLIRYQLSLFIHNLRTISADEEAQRELLSRAYAYTRGPAITFLNAHFLAHNPFELAEQARIHVQVHSILPITDESWQVQWSETELPLHHHQGERTSWQAILSVELDPPETTETLLTNPLGLYITEITWTQTL
ncbi:MAG: conjugal transfer protein [bacterium]|nr:conjugal transfer protein [bacterium]